MIVGLTGLTIAESFRDQGIFYENVTNRILDDLVAVLAPRRLKLVAAFWHISDRLECLEAGGPCVGPRRSDSARQPALRL